MPLLRESCRNETVTVADHRVTVTPRKNCKRLVLRLDQKRNGFALSVPAGYPRAKAMAFLDRQKAWMDRAAGKSLLDWTPAYAAGERHPYLGRFVTLGADGVPTGRAFLTARQRALEALIRRLLPGWETRMGVRAAVIRFRNMRSRWGSCQTNRKEIHLSTILGEVPEECVEYVLVHELCHLLYPDHGAGFHAAMDRFLPDWKQRKSRLTRMDRRPVPPESTEQEGEP